MKLCVCVCVCINMCVCVCEMRYLCWEYSHLVGSNIKNTEFVALTDTLKWSENNKFTTDIKYWGILKYTQALLTDQTSNP